MGHEIGNPVFGKVPKKNECDMLCPRIVFRSLDDSGQKGPILVMGKAGNENPRGEHKPVPLTNQGNLEFSPILFGILAFGFKLIGFLDALVVFIRKILIPKSKKGNGLVIGNDGNRLQGMGNSRFGDSHILPNDLHGYVFKSLRSRYLFKIIVKDIGIGHDDALLECLQGFMNIRPSLLKEFFRQHL